MKSKTLIPRIMVWLTLVSLIMLLINNSLFLHVHKLDDGRIISHAHPFNKSQKTSSGEAKHNHTANEILIYQILDSVSLLLIVFAGIQILIPVIQHLTSYYNAKKHSKEIITGYSIRPPPFLPEFTI